MSFGGNKEKMLVCPYDSQHVIRGDRYLYHIVKCQRVRGHGMNKRVGPDEIPVGAPKNTDNKDLCYLTKNEKVCRIDNHLMQYKQNHPEATRLNESKKLEMVGISHSDAQDPWSETLGDSSSTVFMEESAQNTGIQKDVTEESPIYVDGDCVKNNGPMIPIKMYRSTKIKENVAIEKHEDWDTNNSASTSHKQDPVISSDETDGPQIDFLKGSSTKDFWD